MMTQLCYFVYLPVSEVTFSFLGHTAKSQTTEIYSLAVPEM